MIENENIKHMDQQQSGIKSNLVAKILATKIGNLWAKATKIGSHN